MALWTFLSSWSWGMLAVVGTDRIFLLGTLLWSAVAAFFLLLILVDATRRLRAPI